MADVEVWAAAFVVDADGEATRIESTDLRILSGRHNCAAVPLGAEIVRDGERLGWAVIEPNVVVDDVRIVSLSGQQSIRIGYSLSPPGGGA